MKSKHLLSLMLIIGICACNSNPSDNNTKKKDSPKALEDKSSSYEFASKRGYEDLIESLYDELVSKDVDLKRFEDMLSKLNETKNDSTEAFDKFSNKNLLYYTSANTHLSEIKDSVLRSKIQTLVTSSLDKYNSFVSKHKQLLQLIQEKELSIGDLHQLLKIVKTLPLIEKYQKENLPATGSLEKYILLQNKSINLADTLSSK